MSDQEAIQRAARAQQLIEDPLFVEAWEGLERGAVERLAGCDTHDTKKLQSLTQALQTVRAVRRRMELWIAQGRDAAERQIRKEEQPSIADRLTNRFKRAA